MYDIQKTERQQFGRFHLVRDTVKKGDELYPYSYIQAKDSVCILPFCVNEVVLIRQYRHTLKSWEWELPGGGIDPGLSAELSAAKELHEETGFEAISMKSLGFFFPSPGITTEKCWLYYAECRKIGEPQVEALENIQVKLVPYLQFEKMISNCTFKHGMGIVAWVRYKLVCSNNVLSQLI